MRRTTEGAAPAAGAIRTTRLRWFTGRFMTARDLTDEQEYHLDRHRLHNRLLHGWGTVCGLEVRPHARADCSHEWVRVDAGMALDCYGREIVLPQPEAVHWPVDPSRTSDEDALGVLCIRYDECLTEPLPAIVDGCERGTATELGRVVEAWRFEVHAVGHAPDDPWVTLVRGERTDRACRDGCEDSDVRDGCLEPWCALGDCVPIALLRRSEGRAIEVDAGVRRSLRPTTDQLTHVVGTSWEHGSDLVIDQLTAAGGELRVRFDRDLAEELPDRIGVNEFTFVVEVEDSTGARKRVPWDRQKPPRVVDDREAVFTIDPDVLRATARRGGTRTLIGDTVYVTLLGDLIHDCHRLPVDADFFGTFPTGDGVKGGVLRSWFFVTESKEAGA